MADATKQRRSPVRMIAKLQLRVVEGPCDGLLFEAHDRPVISIGASSDNDMVIEDRTVSRYHLELRAVKGGVEVADLGSRNGILLGGVRITRAMVPAGTRLRLGETVIAIEDAGSVVAPPEHAAPRVPGVVGASDALGEVARLVHRLASVPTSVLIQGETGVGKEVIARALHDHGARKDAPFVVVDCASLPATLIESHLFGHERGAFTGATERRQGAFERGRGGTVLLDEIGELPLDVQPALLGVLERRRFSRVGGGPEIETDARVVAATNRDLRAEVNEGRFRADLYYRLAVARIVIPPLRERPEDIAPLVAHFTEQITGSSEASPFPAAAMKALERHRWSGNARELRNVVEGMVVLGELSLESGPADGHDPGATSASATDLEPYRHARAAAIAAFEAAYLARLIDETDGNASEAARRAKMDRPYLLTLLRKHGLR